MTTDPTEFARVPRTQKTIEELEKEEEVPKYLGKEELALFLTETLGRHKSLQNVVKMRLRDTYLDEGFIFARTKYHPGYPICIKVIEDRMARILKLAGLDQNLTPHSLRHTHASLMSEAGAGLPEIMDRLGHADDETTTKIYLHVTKAKKKETSQKFSELMKSL